MNKPANHVPPPLRVFLSPKSFPSNFETITQFLLSPIDHLYIECCYTAIPFLLVSAKIRSAFPGGKGKSGGIISRLFWLL